MSFKSGFVSIIGKPNVGKSTLLNTIIGEKVAIVSPKPQTTRNKILGILNEDNYQIVFIDTPGIHKSHNKLDCVMQKNIDDAIKGVDVIVYVIDGTSKNIESEFQNLQMYDNLKTILVFSKIDATTFEKLYPKLQIFNELKNIVDIIPISSFSNKNIDVLLEKIKAKLPEGVPYYDNDIYTDKSVKFMCKEIIREKILLLLNKEVPHGTAVEIIEFKEKKDVCVISANIVCEKKSHKQIIIGANGSMIKQIGCSSRADIEKLVDKKINLTLFVKVREDWRDNDTYIGDFIGE